MVTIRFCDYVRSPGSTAGCGKPHVRWCGRGDGRNPVTPSRSFCDNFSRLKLFNALLHVFKIEDADFLHDDIAAFVD